MKHPYCILLSVLFFLAIFFSYGSPQIIRKPYDFLVGDFTFKYKGYDEVAVFSYIGESNTVVIPETITYESKEYKVISIGSYAFNERTEIKEVYIPNSVVEIGERAFKDCSVLESVSIPDSVKFIGSRAFYNCPSLEEIKIDPDNPYLYYNSGILYNKERTVVLSALYDFEGEVHIPDSVTHISSHAFSWQSKITSVVFPSSLKSIGKLAFYYCTMDSLVLPPNLKKIDDGAFWACTMNSITFTGTELDTIEERAFIACHQIKSIRLPEGLKYIGNGAFERCKKLSDITFPSSLGILGSRVFAETPWFENQPDGEIYISDVFYAYKNPPEDLTSVIIREGTKAIAGSVFANCSILQTVSFPEGLKFIGEYAFSGCHKLKSIELPDSLQRIESNTFTGCINLKLTALPPQLNYIGYSAFSWCNIAESIVIPDKVTYIGGGAFADCKKLRYFNIPEVITGMGANPFYGTKWYKKQKKGPVYKGKVFLDYKLRKNKRNAVLKIEEGTKIIAEQSFQNCRNFKKIEIPQSVNYIGFRNLSYKIEWEELIVHWENPSEVVIDDPFISYLKPINCVLRVPKNTSQQYKSLYPWKWFHIVEAE